MLLQSFDRGLGRRGDDKVECVDYNSPIKNIYFNLINAINAWVYIYISIM